MVRTQAVLLWLVLAVVVGLAVPGMAEIIYLDEFNDYDIENPSDFSIDGDPTGNWIPSSDASNATRTFVTGNYGGETLWICNVDGTSITSAGIEIESDRYYTFKAALIAETSNATRGIEASYDLLIGESIETATSLIGGPVSVNAMGDDSGDDGNDSYEEQYTTDTFSTGTVAAGETLFIVITRVGPIPDVSNAWFGVDNVSIDAGPSTMAPTLASPEDGAELVGVDENLVWNAPLAGTPDSYNLIYKDDPNILDTPTIITGITDLSTAPGLAFDTTYSWAVEAVHGGTAYRSFVWTFTIAPATPVIQTSPVSVTVEDGTSVDLTVTYLNNGTVTWYKDGVEVTGENGATLTLAGVKSDEGVYHCVVSNSAGSDISENAVVMTKRLVAHWDFEDGSLVDEIDAWAGTFSDPNVDNDAPDPTDRFIEGYAGDGFDFAGDTYHIAVAESEGLFNFFQNGLTVSCWVKAGTESTGSYSAMVAKHTYSDPRAGFIISQRNSNGIPRLSIDGWGGINGVGGVSVQDGSWHHVVMTYEPGYDPANPDSKQGRIYINGGGVTYDEEDATTWLTSEGAGTGTPALRWDVPVRIGCDNETGAGSLDGTVDEVKIWSYALTATEVAQEYISYETAAEICVDEVLFDYNYDCIVGIEDFAIFAAEWLNSNIVAGS